MSENTHKSRFIVQVLLIIVSVAICILLYYFLINRHSNKSNIVSSSGLPDSAAITRWDVVPHGDKGAAYTVFKDSGVWKIKLHDHNIADADLIIIGRSLKHLSRLAGAGQVNLDKSKWRSAGITDSGTILTIYEGDRIVGSYTIGKLDFEDQYKSYYYFRPTQGESVYKLTETYLDGSAIAKEDNFRKKRLEPIDPSFFTKVRIVSADTNVYYLLENIKGKWSVSGQDIDQIKVLTYLKMLSLLQVPVFATDRVKNRPEASVLIDTKYGPVSYTASKTSDGKWVMASSANVGNCVELTLPQINAIFPPFHFFMP